MEQVQHDNMQTRMQAVAKLKRAASLPRMKDGRRPPMHSEAVSDGEKGHSGESKNGDASPPEPVAEVAADAPVETDASPEGPEVEPEPEEAERPASPAPASRAKRRSRSRSRSRGSKDFKGKARATQSPTPTSQLNGDSSPDEAPPPPPFNLTGLPGLTSPISAQILELQRLRMLRSPTPTSPEPPAFNSGALPQGPAILPSLEALQRGLFRSNSAGGSNANRIMAMHKLTGGTETYDPSPLAGLNRNNTVTGGERLAARNNMFSRLGGRITKEADGDLASGEDRPAPSPTPKRRRRRSRRGSQSVNAGISDSEFTSTSPNTPIPPPTPLPIHPDLVPRSRSTTPFQTMSSPIQDTRQLYPQVEQPFQQREWAEPARRRSVVIEEDDDPPPSTSTGVPISSSPRLPAQITALRLPLSPDGPPNGSFDHGWPLAAGVPVFLNQRTPQRTPPGQNSFPQSPFATPSPMAPRPSDSEDEYEEQVLYGADTHRPRTPFVDASDREISWIATPVPELDERMPVDEDEDEEEEDDELETGQDQNEEGGDVEDEPPLSPRSSTGVSSTEHATFNDTSPRISTDSKSLVVESEISPVTSTYIPLSPSMIALSQTPSLARGSDDSTSPQIFPARLSVASRPPEAADSEDRGATDTPSKRNGEGPTTWEKVKSTFSRAGSSSGRRSRTNSLARERRDQIDSSISRESGASLVSSKLDKGEHNVTIALQQTSPSLMQSPSASASILSLAPPHPVRGGPSPIPPASPADLSKYQDAKLFPFPGMKKLEEQRRAKGLPSASASSPDIATMSSSNDGDLSSFSTHSPTTPSLQSTEGGRDHKLSHQASDSFIGRIKLPSPASSPHPGSFSPSTPRNGSSILPTTIEGVKNYMKWKRGPFASRSTSPAAESHPPQLTQVIPSLPDLFSKDQLEGGWEEIGISPTEGELFSSQLGLSRDATSRQDHLPPEEPAAPRTEYTDTEKTPKAKKLQPPSEYSDDSRVTYPKASPSPSTLLSQLDPFSSATPDPSSSLSDYPARSTSESSSTTSSGYSDPVGLQGQAILEKLGEDLARGSLSRVWPEDDSRRKLLLSSPVFQVVNTNTLKDRFLFLFNDILIIAKPVISDQDAFMDIYKPSPLDRKYIVKSVVLLNQLRFNADRTDAEGNTSSLSLSPRNPVLKAFVNIFSRDPDNAINTLLSKSGKAYDPIALGQLLFKCLDLDRTRHGEYLMRRSSKSVLKSYLDSFGFVGTRVDIALRVFLLSIHVPLTPSHQGNNGLEYFLDAFASRWYEANAKLVDYDKDCAHRLVKAIVQLNELLHDGIAQEPGSTGQPQRQVTSGDFIEAFRRYDPRYLVTDRFLEDVYTSISEERLSIAPSSGSGNDVQITMKRAIPPRLTWKVQSEPIIFRLPHADPDFTIKLYGQDLIFDPPVLQFGKSPEASFRVMGQSLGSKSMILCRSGPNATKYTGLPSSSPIVVERAFLRHTFQVAFQNHRGVKRRYMFSVDDSLLRHQWVSYLKQHIGNANDLLASTSSITSRFRRAAEGIAFRVLQDTLIGAPHVQNSAKYKDRHRLNGNSMHALEGHRFSADRAGPTSSNYHNGSQRTPFHVRSKSRSKVYHRHGAGKHELDVNGAQGYRDFGENDVEGRSESEQDGSPRSDGALWSARDLELHCKHNSSIVSILFAYLQDGEQERGVS